MNTIIDYFKHLFERIAEHSPNVLLFITIIIAFWMVQRYVISFIVKKIGIYYDKRQLSIRKEILDTLEKPIRRLVLSIGIIIAISYSFEVSILKNEMLLKLFKSFVLFFSFQGIYAIVNYYGQNPEPLKSRFNLNLENMLFPFFARIVKVFVFIIGFAMIVYEWGYDINGFVAGLGIGGVAIALGAKDAFSHIFAGLSMAIDKPFAIGDLISTDNNLEGVVEDMNFRSTKIRTLDKALVSVPNAVIANEYIYNWTRRKNRRVRFLLSFEHSLSEEKLKKLTDRIKEVILAHPHVEPDTATIAFDSYTPVSLDLLVLYITDTSDFTEYMGIKQDINYEIMRILKEEDVHLALPSQSIYLNKDLKNMNKELEQVSE